MNMVNRYCKCCHHLAGRPDAAANFCNSHFIPDRWELQYPELSECSEISLIGHCKDCNGVLKETILLPENLAGDDLLKAIYDTMQTAHPYDKFWEQVGYCGSCEERSRFYTSRDNRTQFQRSRQFLDLFEDWDREQVRIWLEKNFPPEKYTEVFRDTGGSLFGSVIRIAKAGGCFDKVKAILDYIRPSEHDSGTHDRTPLTAYEFDFVPIPNYGCEGIYIDCYLKGKFDESGRTSIHVGTMKTLRWDLESAKVMGELCGALMYHASQYVNRELHRYTPQEELEAEYRRQLKQEKASGEGEAGDGR